MPHVDVSPSVMAYTIDPIIDFLFLFDTPQGGQRSGSAIQVVMGAGSKDCVDVQIQVLQQLLLFILHIVYGNINL